MNVQFFDHAHHKLKIRGLKSPVDVLTFTGHEQLSSPFRYDIEFTSTDKAIEPESVLMQDGAFSLSAPPVQGMPVQVRKTPRYTPFVLPEPEPFEQEVIIDIVFPGNTGNRGSWL